MFFEAPDESIWLGVLRLGLVVPGARSLKDKRRAVHQVRDRIQSRYALSVAEVGHRDSSVRCILAVVMVSSDQRLIRSTLDGLSHEVEQWRAVVVEEQSIDIARPHQERFSDFDY